MQHIGQKLRCDTAAKIGGYILRCVIYTLLCLLVPNDIHTSA